jgi:hypothetical protein
MARLFLPAHAGTAIEEIQTRLANRYNPEYPKITQETPGRIAAGCFANHHYLERAKHQHYIQGQTEHIKERKNSW